jgi:hypothetical protein
MTGRPLYPKADILSAGIDVCQVPETDIRISDAALPPKVDSLYLRCAFSSLRSLPTIRVAITQRRTRSAQPEEGVEITEPEDDGEAVEDDGSHRPQRPGAGGADGDHVGVPTEERGAPPIPHEGHFRVAILRGLGVVEDALAVALQPPPGIVVDQLKPPVGPVAHVDVLDVCRITAGVRIAAAHLRSCDDAGCPCRTCVFPSKPEGDTHHECSDGQNRSPSAP